MKGFAKVFAALALSAALVFGMAACSGGGDDTALLAMLALSSGGGQNQSPAPVQNGGEQNNTPVAYNLIIDERIVNGTVIASTTSANPASNAVDGETVALVIIADAGYELDSISVIAANGYAPRLSDLNAYEKTFVMPKQAVRVLAAFKALPVGKNSITPPASISGGKVTANTASSAPGETVTLTATPDEGWRLDSWEVKDDAGNSITVTDNSFTMPDGAVTINATFVKIVYTITVEASANGSVTASPATATVGTRVTLTISPETGCKLDALTVTAEGGAAVSVSGTGNSRRFTMPAKNVTVTAAFVAVASAASGAYTPAGTTKINGVDYELVTFGLWPQTVKADDDTVTVDANKSKQVGDFTYYKGSDGEWYAKIKENAFESGCTYSDGKPVAQSSANSYKWFKVEPIKWRVLTTSYNETNGKKLLLAENVLIAKRYDTSKNNYQNSEIRKWLNSNANSNADSDYGGSGGFLKTAFSASEQTKIAAASVDNDARSTNPDVNATKWNNGTNIYASGTPTTDKVFLLSLQEATKRAYGFSFHDAQLSERIRVPTDYAKASGVNHKNTTIWKGGTWWLRSPLYSNDSYVRFVDHFGMANGDSYISSISYGIVPALCVSD